MTAFAAAIGISSAQGASYEMVIAHLLPEDLTDNEIAPAMAHFKTLVEARIGGDLEVQVFGAGGLGSEWTPASRPRRARRCSRA